MEPGAIDHEVHRAISEFHFGKGLGGRRAQELIFALDAALKNRLRVLAAYLPQGPYSHAPYLGIGVADQPCKGFYGALELELPASAGGFVTHRWRVGIELSQHRLCPKAVSASSHGEHGALAHLGVVVSIGLLDDAAH